MSNSQCRFSETELTALRQQSFPMAVLGGAQFEHEHPEQGFLALIQERSGNIIAVDKLQWDELRTRGRV